MALQQKMGQTRPSPSAKKGKLSTLLRELSDDESDNDSDNDMGVNGGSSQLDDASQPWMKDFHMYLDTSEHVPDGWGAVKWWAVCIYLFLQRCS